MPSWQPNWTDVRFDHAAARDAVDELRRCARLLDDQTTERVRLADLAARDWRGRSREQFDDELRRMRSYATWLVGALGRLATEIERASADARLEQRRREDARARWWDEKRAEDARRAEAGLPPTPGPVRSRARVF